MELGLSHVWDRQRGYQQSQAEIGGVVVEQGGLWAYFVDAVAVTLTGRRIYRSLVVVLKED